MKKTLEASALPVVLVVSVLILMGIFALMEYWRIGRSECARYHFERQQQVHIESAYVLYSNDSFLAQKMETKEGYKLYGEETSRIYMQTEDWGLYEVVRISDSRGKNETVRLLGNGRAAFCPAVLWVCDLSPVLSLAGESVIKGESYVPSGKVAYTSWESVFFQGEKIAETELKESGRDLPEARAAAWQCVEKWTSFSQPEEAVETAGETENSFRQPALELRAGKKLAGVKLKGHIVVKSEEFLEIDSCCELTDVIVVAPSVHIRAGFQGNLQVFATDTVIVGERVRLSYPSGIFLDARKGEGRVHVGETARISGYVIALGNDKKLARPLYCQQRSASIRGMLYVNGIAQLEGKVEGCAWLRHCYYFTPSGYYPDLLLHVLLSENRRIAYPFWLPAPYGKKLIKWLY